MTPLLFIPFAIFFLCCFAQFLFLKQIRDRLIDHHPEEFLAAERSSMFPQTGLWRFVWRGRHKDLNDPELDRHVRNMRILYAVAILAWLGIVAAMFLAPARI